MPALKEAAVILTGTVMDVEQTREYVDGKPTDTIKGQKVIIGVGGGDGYAAVSLSTAEANTAQPVPGSSVAWVVRFGAWSRGDNAQNSCRFVRLVTPGDLDRLLSASDLSATK